MSFLPHIEIAMPDRSGSYMRVLLNTEFAASRKEPLVQMFDRIVNGFTEAGLGSPAILFPSPMLPCRAM